MFTKLHARTLERSSAKFSDRQRRIYDFLVANPIGVLSSVDPNGAPHGVVIYYRIDSDFKVFFLTRTQTRKYDNLTHNPHTMLTVFEPKTQTTVQITGTVQKINSSHMIDSIAGYIHGISLKTSESGILPITKLEAGEYTAFRINPVQIRMAVYARPDSGGYQDMFESVESFVLYD